MDFASASEAVTMTGELIVRVIEQASRPISAQYSSCRPRIESGEPSNPDRLASTTSGRLPLAALMARAAFFDDFGNSVPAV